MSEQVSVTVAGNIYSVDPKSGHLLCNGAGVYTAHKSGQTGVPLLRTDLTAAELDRYVTSLVRSGTITHPHG